jgi:hypothetical protein
MAKKAGSTIVSEATLKKYKSNMEWHDYPSKKKFPMYYADGISEVIRSFPQVKVIKVGYSMDGFIGIETPVQVAIFKHDGHILTPKGSYKKKISGRE